MITPTTKAYQPSMLTNVGNKNIYILSSVVCILKYPFEGLAYSGYFFSSFIISSIHYLTPIRKNLGKFLSCIGFFKH